MIKHRYMIRTSWKDSFDTINSAREFIIDHGLKINSDLQVLNIRGYRWKDKTQELSETKLDTSESLLEKAHGLWPWRTVLLCALGFSFAGV